MAAAVGAGGSSAASGGLARLGALSLSFTEAIAQPADTPAIGGANFHRAGEAARGNASVQRGSGYRGAFPTQYAAGIVAAHQIVIF
ncbi:hypothetical protein EB235_19770 [Mesorhizobium loti R88b]|uniref:Uncharacterized protein n=1 Tax=Mesorhizobium loti R88b TaxID=935548 RepID=A0A6M7WTV4_RHILI|nr:hypothetical protein EB235_19770 [Mesorhizobium loti R88b]